MPRAAGETEGALSVDLAAIVALREEARALASRLERRRGLRLGSVRCEEGRLGGARVVIARTGIGNANARQKTRELFSYVRPAAVLATGFAGGIDDALRPGDLVVASEVAADSRDAAPVAPWTLSTELATGCREVLARRNSPPDVFVGRLVSVEKVVAGSSAKRELHARTAALAVDMESNAVVREASTRAAVVACARVVLDEAAYELPFDFGRLLTPEGRIRPLLAAASVAARPHRVFALPELRRRAEIAATRLREFFPAALEWMLEGTKR